MMRNLNLSKYKFSLMESIDIHLLRVANFDRAANSRNSGSTLNKCQFRQAFAPIAVLVPQNPMEISIMRL